MGELKEGAEEYCAQRSESCVFETSRITSYHTTSLLLRMDIHYWKLLAKYVADEASEQEVEMLEAWIEADPARRELLREAEQAWKATKKSDALRTDSNVAWSRFEERIEKAGVDSGPPASEKRNERRGRASRQRARPVSWRLLRTAGGGLAIVLAIVLVVTLWSSSESKVMVTKRGERSTIELVDGTRVHLNAESELTLLPEFGRGVREVQLKGEAYFDVAHDERRPFQVHTPEGVIQVVGTAFNVNAYGDNGGAEVAVTEGAVALHVKKSTRATRTDTVVLRPRQFGIVANQRLHDFRRGVDLTARVAWREGRLVFEDAPFREVVRRLERWYDLQIEAPDDSASIDRLNAVFDREAVSEVISDIATALDLQYEQKGKRITFFRRASSASLEPEKALLAE